VNKKVKNIIDGIFPISEKSFKEIESLLKFENFKKGEIFIQKNKLNNKEYFTLSGVCKSYLINLDGDEITISLFTENSILSPHQIRTPKNISNLYFKALTNLKLASINAKEFENLMIENIEIRNFANTVLQNELILKVEKEIGLASLSAKERLIEFYQMLMENIFYRSNFAKNLNDKK